MSLDLVNWVVSEKRKEQNVTVLTKAGGWSKTEVDLVVKGLRTSVSQHPKYPDILLIDGRFSKDIIGMFVLEKNFECAHSQGLDNPALPFTPVF